MSLNVVRVNGSPLNNDEILSHILRETFLYRKNDLLRTVGRDLQNCYDPLAVRPTHLLGELDASEKITSTAGSEEETIVQHEVAGHGYCFSVGYPEYIGRRAIKPHDINVVHVSVFVHHWKKNKGKDSLANEIPYGGVQPTGRLHLRCRWRVQSYSSSD